MGCGKLTICPTPIGNLGDVTERALDALRGADVVCAEDTRVTGRLLAAFGIHARLERLDEARMADHAADVVGRVAAGQKVAYCSDAGMPGVSDPGGRLVRAAREAGVPVEVLPGPSAAVTAYVASGTASPRYYFGGFLPRKASERAALLDGLRTLDAALVFYESPRRLVASLESIATAFPTREAAVCRELTKLHEEIIRDAVAPLRDEFARRGRQADEGEGPGIKGEVVVVVDAPSEAELAGRAHDGERAAAARAAELAADGLGAKDIARALSAEFGIPRNLAYDLALKA